MCGDANTYACNLFAVAVLFSNVNAHVCVHSHLYLCDACGRLLFNHNKKSEASITILNHQKGPLGGALLAGTIVCNPLLSSYIKTYLILKQGLPVLILFPREEHRLLITNEHADRCSSPGNRMRFFCKAHPVSRSGASIADEPVFCLFP